MHGASSAAPHGRCLPHHMRHKARLLPELFAMMGPEGFGGPRGGFGDEEHHEHGPHRGRGPGGRGGPGRGRRARRGDIRSAALLLLAEEPRNGYGLMQEIEDRSGGVWRPSPGSVYPALAQLEDEGLVRATEVDGRKAFELTDEGRAHVEERRDKLGLPWETESDGARGELHELRHAGRALAIASMQVAQTGTKEQLAEAKRILENARRALYRVLAGDPAPEDEPPADAS